MKKTLMIGGLLASLLIAAACTGNDADVSNADESLERLLYENADKGITVKETSDWVVTRESGADADEASINVIFENGDAQAILTVVTAELEPDKIKQHILTGAGSVEVLSDSEHHLSFQTRRNESLRGDIYIYPGDVHTGVIIFMTPVDVFEEHEPKMQALYDNVDFQ